MLDRNIFPFLSQLLYPKGRAWRMPEPKEGDDLLITEQSQDNIVSEDGTTLIVAERPLSSGGVLFRLHRAIGVILKKTYNDVLQIQNDMLPDNPLFDIGDAHDWYRRLGLFDSGSVSLTDMKAAIRQKMSWAGTPLNRQSRVYIEEQLRAAGFDVYVYENNFGGVAMTPAEILGIPTGQAFYGNFDYGQLNYGALYSMEGISVIFNYLEPEKDQYALITEYKSTFYIAGATVSTFVDIPASRQTEFRQLVLKLKTAQMAAFAFINFI